MAIEVVQFLDGPFYPKFQSEGNFMQYVIPFASKVCSGNGLDIGCKKVEWAFPGARPIDIEFNEVDENGKIIEAYNLPGENYDYIISSHCLEHLPNWVAALDYWLTKLKSGGVLYLYLPHKTQQYWLPFNNLKHIHCLDEDIIKKYFIQRDINISGWNSKKMFISSYDINNSFTVMIEKR